MSDLSNNISEVKSSLTEDALIEFICNQPQLRYINKELSSAADDPDTRPTEFKTLVQYIIGRHFSAPVFDQIDWDYVGAQWWCDPAAQDARNEKRPDSELSGLSLG